MTFSTPPHRLNRLDLAKRSFEAYHLRTQAYDFHNAVGLIDFNSFRDISIELKLGRCSDEFEVRNYVICQPNNMYVYHYWFAHPMARLFYLRKN